VFKPQMARTFRPTSMTSSSKVPTEPVM
jgi:hypothetical protein